MVGQSLMVVAQKNRCAGSLRDFFGPCVVRLRGWAASLVLKGGRCGRPQTRQYHYG